MLSAASNHFLLSGKNITKLTPIKHTAVIVTSKKKFMSESQSPPGLLSLTHDYFLTDFIFTSEMATDTQKSKILKSATHDTKKNTIKRNPKG